jgi:hypothetical protein
MTMSERNLFVWKGCLYFAIPKVGLGSMGSGSECEVQKMVMRDESEEVKCR